jgi:hypothetical protein
MVSAFLKRIAYDERPVVARWRLMGFEWSPCSPFRSIAVLGDRQVSASLGCRVPFQSVMTDWVSGIVDSLRSCTNEQPWAMNLIKWAIPRQC